MKIGDQQSDAEYTSKALADLGYFCHIARFDCRAYGSSVPRERLYWLAVRGLQDGSGTAEVALEQCLVGMSTRCGPSVKGRGNRPGQAGARGDSGASAYSARRGKHGACGKGPRLQGRD